MDHDQFVRVTTALRYATRIVDPTMSTDTPEYLANFSKSHPTLRNTVCKLMAQNLLQATERLG